MRSSLNESDGQMRSFNLLKHKSKKISAALSSIEYLTSDQDTFVSIISLKSQLQLLFVKELIGRDID